MELSDSGLLREAIFLERISNVPISVAAAAAKMASIIEVPSPVFWDAHTHLRK